MTWRHDTMLNYTIHHFTCAFQQTWNVRKNSPYILHMRLHRNDSLSMKMMKAFYRSWHQDWCYSHLPEALSPQTLQATNVFVPVDELDEFESAADDDVVVAFDDDVGENGWLSATKRRSKLLISFKSFKNSDLYARTRTCCSKDNWE